jgi:uncharacterized protein YdhG (YjbR/CyaY superfamily)
MENDAEDTTVYRVVGFYPTPSPIEKFKSELSAYRNAKGSAQFPLDRPLPLGLIERIVKFRVAEVRAKRDAASLR